MLCTYAVLLEKRLKRTRECTKTSADIPSHPFSLVQEQTFTSSNPPRASQAEGYRLSTVCTATDASDACPLIPHTNSPFSGGLSSRRQRRRPNGQLLAIRNRTSKPLSHHWRKQKLCGYLWLGTDLVQMWTNASVSNLGNVINNIEE